MADDKRFIEDVLTVLEIGADHPCTREELDQQVRKRDLQGVHIYGAYGLFETSKSDAKERLNVAGLNLLMSHRSIQQAEQHARQANRQALIATWIAAAACVLTLLTFLWTILSDCVT